MLWLLTGPPGVVRRDEARCEVDGWGDRLAARARERYGGREPRATCRPIIRGDTGGCHLARTTRAE